MLKKGTVPTQHQSIETPPLAERSRPKEFQELLGQDGIWSQRSKLWQLVEKDGFHSLLFWGPPGVGKTSLAKLIAEKSDRPFVYLSAVSCGVKDIRAVLDADDARGGLIAEKKPLMFMDEIHRLNKGQQDVLLPALESGQIKFIGATTENPSFEVNKAILSRCLVFRFMPLSKEALVQIMRNALEKYAQAHPTKQIPHFEEDLLKHIAHSSDHDARRALNILEAILVSSEGQEHASVDDLAALLLDSRSRYDKNADMHYDIISAFIKSIRASHPDAAVYYLARMIDAGEDPIFIARRMVILASEDIGNATPTALLVATSAMQAVHLVGYPEARIILAQAATYLASCAKSNRSYEAIEAALKDVKDFGSLEVPMHLRNAATQFMKSIGYGKNYKYAHSDPEGAKRSQYLPDEIKGKRYYIPSNSGSEAAIGHNLERLRPNQD